MAGPCGHVLTSCSPWTSELHALPCADFSSQNAPVLDSPGLTVSTCTATGNPQPCNTGSRTETVILTHASGGSSSDPANQRVGGRLEKHDGDCHGNALRAYPHERMSGERFRRGGRIAWERFPRQVAGLAARL